MVNLYSRRLELQSSTVLRFSPPQQLEAMDDDKAATLEAAQITELQQKLVLVEQAVNKKDLELKKVMSKLEEVEEKAKELE